MPAERADAVPRRLARRRPLGRRAAARRVLVLDAPRAPLAAAELRHLPALLKGLPRALSGRRRLQPVERGEPLRAADVPPPPQGGGLLQRAAGRLPDLPGRGRRPARLGQPRPLAGPLPAVPARQPPAVVAAQLHRRQPAYVVLGRLLHSRVPAAPPAGR